MGDGWTARPISSAGSSCTLENRRRRAKDGRTRSIFKKDAVQHRIGGLQSHNSRPAQPYCDRKFSRAGISAMRKSPPTRWRPGDLIMGLIFVAGTTWDGAERKAAIGRWAGPDQWFRGVFPRSKVIRTGVCGWQIRSKAACVADLLSLPNVNNLLISVGTRIVANERSSS